MSRRTEIDRDEPRNLLVFAAYEIVFRVAWLFKTESVIVPAFLDALTGGTGWIRGWLPMLSRLGQGVPPLFYADRLRDAPQKSRILRLTSLLMGAPVAAVAWIALVADPVPAPWMPYLFLAVYVLFFSITGLNQLVQGTLHGKLIRADRRGRLMWISGTIGPALAILAAWLVLGPWLDRPGVGRFAPIFTLTAAGFLVCGMITFALSEPDDRPVDEPPVTVWSRLRTAWWVYRSDTQFRRAARVVMLLTCIVLIFPHFQWLAREQLDLDDRELMIWVVAQNVGVACFSPLSGFLADRFGNRLVIRLQCLFLFLAPLLALALAYVDRQVRTRLDLQRAGIAKRLIVTSRASAAGAGDPFAEGAGDSAQLWAMLPVDPRATEGVQVAVVACGAQADASAVAADLAIGLSRHGGERVAFVSCVTGPTAFETRGQRPNAPGWSEVLRGELSLAGAMQKTPVAGLDYLPAGEPGEGQLHPTASREFTALLDRLRKDYRFVVVQVADLAVAPESYGLLRVSEAALLVARSRGTVRADLERASVAVESSGARLLAAVLQPERRA
mgnify:CR=1 FL=1